MMNKRDKTIDRLRGFAMLWVILVHVLYWENFFPGSYRIRLLKSFFLFEMPLFFFLTGASNSFSRDRGYLSFVCRRYQRMLIPYWVFAVLCAGISILMLQMDGGAGFGEAAKVLISWLNPFGEKITTVHCLDGALWFVPVYLCVILLVPLFKSVHRSPGRYAFGVLLGVSFVITCLWKQDLPQKVAFYGLWTYIGLFYGDIRKGLETRPARLAAAGIAAAGMALLCFLYLDGRNLDMQQNKFPPNLIFLLFSFAAMSVLLLLLPRLDALLERVENTKVAGRIFELYAKRSMTIFLYQAFAFPVTIRAAKLLMPGGDILSGIGKSLFCLITTVPLCAGLALLFGKVETWEIKGPGKTGDR